MRRTSGFALVAALFFAATSLVTVTALAQSDLRTEGDAAAARGIYQAEVPVNSQGEAERAGGFARALGSVLSKVSGDRNAMGRPGVGAELRNAKTMSTATTTARTRGLQLPARRRSAPR